MLCFCWRAAVVAVDLCWLCCDRGWVVYCIVLAVGRLRSCLLVLGELVVVIGWLLGRLSRLCWSAELLSGWCWLTLYLATVKSSESSNPR